MVEISVGTFAENCIHTITQLKKRQRTGFMDKN